MTRREIFDEWDRSNVRCDAGLALRTDDAIERLFFKWDVHKRPSNVIVGIDDGLTGELLWITYPSTPVPEAVDVSSLF